MFNIEQFFTILTEKYAKYAKYAKYLLQKIRILNRFYEQLNCFL